MSERETLHAGNKCTKKGDVVATHKGLFKTSSLHREKWIPAPLKYRHIVV